MERVVLGVGPVSGVVAIGVNGAEHVVVGEQVVEAELLDRSPDPPDRDRIASELDLRVDDADLQGAARRLPQGLHRASSSHGCRCLRGSAMSPFRVPWAFMPAMPGSRLAGSLRLCRQFPGLALAEALASRCEIVAPPGHG